MAWHRVASGSAVALGQQPDSPDGSAAAMCPSCSGRIRKAADWKDRGLDVAGEIERRFTDLEAARFGRDRLGGEELDGGVVVRGRRGDPAV